MVEERLLPEGINVVPGNGAINPTDSLETAAAKAKVINSPENLVSLLTVSNGNHEFMFGVPIGNGYVVSEVVPSAPYSEGGLMVCAGNPEQIKEGSVGTQTIYDMPKDVQRAYWQVAIANLLAFDEHTPNDPKYKIMATENTTPHTSEQHRTSRTIDIPHLQINRFDISAIQPGKVDMPSLKLETRIMGQPRVSQEFAEKVYEDMDEAAYEELGALKHIKARQVAPYGYTIVFDIDKGNALAKVSDIQRIMFRHHMAYTNQSTRVLAQSNLKETNQQRVIPQPSYRTYMFFDNGHLNAIISPEFLSHAGITEAAGVQTVRNPEAVSRFSQEELAHLRESVKGSVMKRINHSNSTQNGH